MPINTLRFSLRHIPWLLHDMIRTNPSIHKVTESPTPQKGIVWCATSMMCTIFMHKHISANNSNIVGFLCFLLKITWNSPCVSSKVTAREVLGVIKLHTGQLKGQKWKFINIQKQPKTTNYRVTFTRTCYFLSKSISMHTVVEFRAVKWAQLPELVLCSG